jgi:NAD(P)-dependent dehydrogenase (short-subunit alcohol dehydrogenase family)
MRVPAPGPHGPDRTDIVQEEAKAMADLLKGKVALVTGGGSGIGKATSIIFAREGAKVMVADVNDEAAERTKAEIIARGGEAAAIRVDVSNEADAEAMVEATVEAFGGLHVAFNNAGIEGLIAPTHEYPVRDWQRIIDINLTGVWLGMRYQIAWMREHGGGAIVNNASILGLVGFENTPGYTAAKHGVIGLTKTAALENAKHGIRVNAVCPGFIETPLVMERGVEAGRHPEVYEELKRLHPMGRLGQPEEIGEAVVWLASSAASFVTGHALAVDGGYLAR